MSSDPYEDSNSYETSLTTDPFELFLRTLKPKKSNICLICYYLELPNAHEIQYTYNIDHINNHIKKLHAEILEIAKNNPCYSVFRYDSSISAMKDEEKSDYDIKTEINYLHELVENYLAYKMFTEENSGPGILHAKDVDWTLYLSPDSLKEVINLVDSSDLPAAVKKLHSNEPGAKYIPFSEIWLHMSSSLLATEVLNLHETFQITKIRKVQVQYLVDLVKSEVAEIEGVYPVYSKASKFKNVALIKRNTFVIVHGSYATGLATMESELDIALFVESDQSQKWLMNNQQLIFDYLVKRFSKNSEFEFKLLASARIPTLQVKHNKVPVFCNITIATEYTNLQTYLNKSMTNFHPCYIPLITLLKKWSKSIKLDSSYSYILQVMAKIYLHAFDDNFPTPKTIITHNNMSLNSKLDFGRQFYCSINRDIFEPSELGLILVDFFGFYSGVNICGSMFSSFRKRYVYNNSAIAISYHGADAILPRSELSIPLDDPFVIILNFDTKENIAKFITNESLLNLRIEFRKFLFKTATRQHVENSIFE